MSEREELIKFWESHAGNWFLGNFKVEIQKTITALSEQGEPVAWRVQRKNGTCRRFQEYPPTEDSYSLASDEVTELYDRPQPLQRWVNGRILLLEAIARGWCSPKNSHKEMDCDLVEAIADEIEAAEALKADQAETANLRRLLEMAEPFITSQAGAEHMLDGFRPQERPIDKFVAEIKDALATTG